MIASLSLIGSCKADLLRKVIFSISMFVIPHHFGAHNRTVLYLAMWKNFGVSVNFVSSADPDAFAAAIDEDTKAIFIEVMGNPSLVMFDIASLAKVIYSSDISSFSSGLCPLNDRSPMIIGFL